MNPFAPVYQDVDLPDGAREMIIAKDQPEFEPLPAVVLDGGEVITRWKLSAREIAHVLETGCIYLTVFTGGRRLQPLILSVLAPEIVEAEPEATAVS